MTSTEIVTPKVFISYSWTNELHKMWVRDLAARLKNDGVHVILDIWHLKPGHDKYAFMEQSVKDPEINKVLIICDKSYTKKANNRQGGVGNETMIISPEIYNNVAQEKFIPIIAERSEDGIEFLPAFLKSRMYYDFTQDRFEPEYERFIRDLYNRPSEQEPKLGSPPAYLFKEQKNLYSITKFIRIVKGNFDINSNKLNSLLRDFLYEYFESLKSFTINDKEGEYGKKVVDTLHEYDYLKKEYIDFLTLVTKNEYEIDADAIISFFEKLHVLKYPLDDRNNWSSNEFDIFKIIIHELYIYTITICLINENYKLAGEFLLSSYFIDDKMERNSEPKNFTCFYLYVDSIDTYYKKLYQQDFFSPTADLIIKRLPESISKSQFVKADLICHYVGALHKLEWFPMTYIYNLYGYRSIDIFIKLQSTKHFNKIKDLFGISNIDEFKYMLKRVENSEFYKDRNYWNYRRSFDRIIPIFQMIDIDKIGILR